MRDDCALATGSKDAGEVLAQVLELDVEIGLAGSAAERLSLAMKRREALKRLVDAVGG